MGARIRFTVSQGTSMMWASELEGVGYSMTSGKTPATSGDPVGQLLRNPSIALVYDYLLGGKDNFGVDRRLGDELLGIYPQAAQLARDNRAFVARAVQYAAGHGIAQFIDIGCGLPASPNVHEVAQAVAPGARVVYVDRDPVVLALARAGLANGNNEVGVVAGDMRDPGQVLTEPQLGKFIDLGQPACLLLAGVLHFAAGDAADAIVRGFTAALSGNSYLVISAGTARDPELAKRFTAAYPAGDLHAHPAETIASWFDGFTMVKPGLVEAAAWRPAGPRRRGSPPPVATVLAGVGRKPGGPP